jgi:eukaryotic-like serine/threonine-protein kinase
MTGDGTSRARALRPTDPAQLGPYRLVGRLGEGGMGLVYLAGAPDGRPVAVKVIRTDLADDEFRRRFRGEVARARQVPPFCTAEVIDADTDHDPPYLVVEYVDGPSLSAVVQERGPLTPANQHGLAVGVAVALTAIHGAGVIHRDLKPSNVLLAPGSPKVIDFGIARGLAGTDVETRANQMVGTVAYMAPERFDGQSATTAADVFAWGGVVAYAGTGRTPFAAETPAAVAIRIMTRPPDLDGLSGPLRDLVEWAVAKNPADRPSARELLDHLVAGAERAPTRPASFAQQPEVLAAAGITAGLSLGPTATVYGSGVPAGPTAGHPGRAAYPAGPTAYQPGPAAYPAGPTLPPVGGAGTGPTVVPTPPRRGMRVAIAGLTLAVLLLAGAVAGIVTGKLPLGPRAAGAGPGHTPTTTSTGPGPGTTSAPPESPDAMIPTGSTLFVRDSLAAAGRWKVSELATFEATCALDGQLTVTLGRRQAGSYRCKGITDQFTDFTVTVDAILANTASCAGVWFRFDDKAGGYALRVCRDRIQLMTHVEKTQSLVSGSYLDVPIEPGQPVRVAVRADGNRMLFFLDDALVHQYVDVESQFSRGKIVLGVFPVDSEAEPPFAASFANIEIYKPAVSG